MEGGRMRNVSSGLVSSVAVESNAYGCIQM